MRRRFGMRPLRTAPIWNAPVENRLGKAKARLLIIAPCFAEDRLGRVLAGTTETLCAGGWEVSLVAAERDSGSGAPRLAALTPDVFSMPAFLRPKAYPCFLAYLIRSRRPDVVMLIGSRFGYRALPYLRAECPDPAYVDWCLGEPASPTGGGALRREIGYHDFLDLHLCATPGLRRRLMQHGADAERVVVWAPDGRAAPSGVPDGDMEGILDLMRQVGVRRRSPPPPALPARFARECAAQAIEHLSPDPPAAKRAARRAPAAESCLCAARRLNGRTLLRLAAEKAARKIGRLLDGGRRRGG